MLPSFEGDFPGIPMDFGSGVPSFANPNINGAIEIPLMPPIPQPTMQIPMEPNNMSSVVPNTQNAQHLDRLERNRVSARESRKRKREYVENLENQVGSLKDEVKALREQLRLGKEGERRKLEDETHLIQSIKRSLSQDKLDDVESLVKKSSEEISDYGQECKNAVDIGLQKLRTLIGTSQVSKLFLFLGNQKDEFFATNLDEDGTPKPDHDHDESLWTSLRTTLGITSNQEEKFMDLRPMLHDATSKVSNALYALDSFRVAAMNKISSMNTIMEDVFQVFSVEQRAKFLVWIHNNRACMNILDKFWDLSKLGPSPTKKYKEIEDETIDEDNSIKQD
eukprot:TRINITY_DN634_c0_g5_i1.p1 TRINITY_DN634_c0_g5~~TRINITY_DN634_c0_g5_i1.p1  ORF type:complete len:347 (+),score=77.60 TRINITY_DN634_c0_g5_i1:34-1041(+)